MKDNWIMDCVASIGSLVGAGMLMKAGNDEESTVGKVVDYGIAVLLAAGSAFSYAQALFVEE